MSLGCGDVKRTRRIPSTAPDRPEQVGEQRAQRGRVVAAAAGGQLDVAAVAVDVLPEQGHLGDTLAGERLDLGDDVGERPAHLLAAHRGDDAERAAVVAADLDRHPGVERRHPLGRQRRREHRVIVDDGRFEDLGDRTVLAGVLDELGGAVHVVRTEHDVDVPGSSRGPRRGPSGPGSRTPRSGGRPSRPSTS